MVVTITAKFPLQDLKGPSEAKGETKRAGQAKSLKIRRASRVGYSLRHTLRYIPYLRTLHLYMSHIGLLHATFSSRITGLDCSLKNDNKRYVAGKLVTKQNMLPTFTLCRFV